MCALASFLLKHAPGNRHAGPARPGEGHRLQAEIAGARTRENGADRKGGARGVSEGFRIVLRRGDAQIIGPAISYTIGQGATMVSAVWGVFVWKEFANAPSASRKLIPLMFVFFLVGLGAVALAPVFPR